VTIKVIGNYNLKSILFSGFPRKYLKNDNRSIYAQFEAVINELGMQHKCVCKEYIAFFP
jgi:phage terminase large subunit